MSECWHEPTEVNATVAVIGAGKMGLPLCAQYASHGWNVIAVDRDPEVVASINRGECHIGDEPGVPEVIRASVMDKSLRATTDLPEAVSQALVVVVIIPVGLTESKYPSMSPMHELATQIGRSVRQGATVIFETTMPIGSTAALADMMSLSSGMSAGDDFMVAFSPERVSSGSVMEDLARYPKLVGGVNEDSTRLAMAFYDSVLDAAIMPMSSAESAEFSKLMETTYRDVNIALANELADIADDLGLDVQESIRAANTQPHSHVHTPGIGVGGHCIPVYPHLLMDSTNAMTPLIRGARHDNEDRPWRWARIAGKLRMPRADNGVLVLGLTYRAGVKELANSPGVELCKELKHHFDHVYAWDPLLSADEVREAGVEAWKWGDQLDVDVIVSTTADPAFEQLFTGWFPRLNAVLDGRNSLRGLRLPEDILYVGVGVQDMTRISS